MTLRDLLVGVSVGAFALAALALGLAIRAIVRRARAGRPRVWAGLVFRGALIVGLLAVGAASLAGLPPPEMVNHPAPAPADATVSFLQNSRDGKSQMVVGVSARDGVTRWTRTLDVFIGSLLSPTPDMILASSSNNGVYALRAGDGAVLWHSKEATNITPGAIAADDARVYALTPGVPTTGVGTATMDVIALDLQTGALVWRAPLPVSVTNPRQLAIGDGLVFVAGVASDAIYTGTDIPPWMVVALRAADGARQWAIAGEAVNRGLIWVQALFVERGNVIVVPTYGLITALRERDGALAWRGAAAADILAAAADTDAVYVVEQPTQQATGANGAPAPPQATVMALDVGSGTTRWSDIPYVSTGREALAVSDGALLRGVSVTASTGWAGYNPEGSVLYAYAAASGRLLWRDNTPPTGISWDLSPEISPWGGNGAVYLMGIQTDPYVQDRFQCVIFCPGVSWLYAVNIRTGAPWWRVRIGYVSLSHLVF